MSPARSCRALRSRDGQDRAPPAREGSHTPNRPARFITADLRPAVKVSEEFGPEWVVEILPDGTIRLTREAPKKPPEDEYDEIAL